MGTANIYGATANVSGIGTTGLNVAVAYRIGKNSVLNSTPKITGPFKSPAIQDTCPGNVAANNPPGCLGVDPFSTGPTAPSVFETSQAVGTIEGTLQTVRPNDPICDAASTCTNIAEAPNATTFGQSGGVFSLGILPANSTNNGVPYSYTPYPFPMYDTTGVTQLPWGGPPKFDPDGHGDGVRDGYNNNAQGTGVQGVSLGINTFEGVTSPAGTYMMTLQIPNAITSSGSSSYSSVTATATISSPALLPDLVTPAMVEDGNGGGSFAAFAPTITAPFYEAFVQIVDYGPGGTPSTLAGNCQGPLGPGEAGPVYYTLLYHPGDAAATALALPDTIGPNSSAGKGTITLSPTLCTAAQNTAALGTATPGDSYSVQVIGVDYPLYEASPLLGGNAPTLTGASGQADISLSVPTTYVYGTPGGTPLSRNRKLTIRRN